ncbi:hypothetical protein Bbelb_372200 [Branchiostoma belcheri]|nr:hypothetical protein Bbelb_372200 [Branchiostoma belcheri]
MRKSLKLAWVPSSGSSHRRLPPVSQRQASFIASGGTTSAFGRDTPGGGHQQAGEFVSVECLERYFIRWCAAEAVRELVPNPLHHAGAHPGLTRSSRPRISGSATGLPLAEMTAASTILSTCGDVFADDRTLTRQCPEYSSHATPSVKSNSSEEDYRSRLTWGEDVAIGSYIAVVVVLDMGSALQLCGWCVQHQGQGPPAVWMVCSAPRTGPFSCVDGVFSTKDRALQLCGWCVQHQGQGPSAVWMVCSAPRTDPFSCVDAPRTGPFSCVKGVFSAKDRALQLCGWCVQHQGQIPSAVWMVCSAPRTVPFSYVNGVFSTKDRALSFVDGVFSTKDRVIQLCEWTERTAQADPVSDLTPPLHLVGSSVTPTP